MGGKGAKVLRDALLVDGLSCPFEGWAMGHAAEFIAETYGITREAMDHYALASHQKAIAAIDTGVIAWCNQCSRASRRT